MVHSIQFAKQFQLQQAQYLPQFASIWRHGMKVIMSLAVAEINLRSIIGNRSLMEVQGGTIVTLIIRGLTEVDQQQVCLRSITPSSITISNDLERLIFGDIHSICL